MRDAVLLFLAMNVMIGSCVVREAIDRNTDAVREIPLGMARSGACK